MSSKGLLADVFDFEAVNETARSRLVRDGVSRATSFSFLSTRERKNLEPVRDAKHRARYAGRPADYMRDILGLVLSPQQEEALALIEANDRVLIPSGNNQGKTFLLGAYAVYRMDAVAATLDEYGHEIGGRVLLPGPDHSTIYATIYGEILNHTRAAVRRGFPMPGRVMPDSVLWRVRGQWEVEAFSPPKNNQLQVAHTASGRHHQNQVALIEEGQGVPEQVWKGAEGMCSSEGNKIVSTFNPTEPSGPAYQRAKDGAYAVMHMSAFKHPNVTQRKSVFPSAVSHRIIDKRVGGAECRDRGTFPDTMPQTDAHDFVYALPPAGAVDDGAREDGFLGHRDGELRVYRPGPSFVSQVLGEWPESVDGSLFSAAALDRSNQRWRARQEPVTMPDRVGFDPARDGDDEACAVPAWGKTGIALLRDYIQAQATGPDTLAKFLDENRAYVGEIKTLARGDGPPMADEVLRRFGRVPYVVDEGGVGSSPLDHMRYVLKLDAAPVSFAATAPDPPRLGFVPYCDNVRAWIFVILAKLLDLDLVDLPPDPLLREELMCLKLVQSSRNVEVFDDQKNVTEKKRMPSVLLMSKDEVRKAIGRSHDRADAIGLSILETVGMKKTVSLTWGS